MYLTYLSLIHIFYITNIREQAERWAFRIGRQLQESPILNIYELDIERIEKEYRSLKFKKYDQQWLEFIVKSRKGEKPWATYDIVEGVVANDRVSEDVYKRQSLHPRSCLPVPRDLDGR